jgi:catechol 2,3-dioxygenase-like lactoylglutathione lyase family enzyme
MMQLQQIDHVAMRVDDLERSLRWYTEVLGMERRYAEAWQDRPAVVCAGSTCLALFAAPPDGPPADPRAPGMLHLAFRVDAAGFRAAQAELDRREIAWTLSDHTISHSIYFSDPDGYRLEITTYELEALAKG